MTLVNAVTLWSERLAVYCMTALAVSPDDMRSFWNSWASIDPRTSPRSRSNSGTPMMPSLVSDHLKCITS